jgi:Holliday junction resolvasome RuvABC endonuclease subunit
MLTEPLRSVRAVAGTEYVTEIVEERVRAVDVIAYERAHHRGGAATALCVGLATVMLEEAARLGIETTAVATTTLKKHAAGKGNAGKGDMTRAAMKRWGDRHLMGRELTSDDEADALCVLAWSMDEIGVKA